MLLHLKYEFYVTKNYYFAKLLLKINEERYLSEIIFYKIYLNLKAFKAFNF